VTDDIRVTTEGTDPSRTLRPLLFTRSRVAADRSPAIARLPTSPPSSSVKSTTSSAWRSLTCRSRNCCATSMPPSRQHHHRSCAMWHRVRVRAHDDRGSFRSVPSRPSDKLPAVSIRTSSPAASIRRSTYARPATSASLNATRLTPPSGFAPKCASSARCSCSRPESATGGPAALRATRAQAPSAGHTREQSAESQPRARSSSGFRLVR